MKNKRLFLKSILLIGMFFLSLVISSCDEFLSQSFNLSSEIEISSEDICPDSTFSNEEFSSNGELHEHIWDDGEVSIETTCISNGEITYKCTVCNESKVDIVAALGHDYNSVVTKSTCVDKGYTTHTCSRCDNSYVDSYVEATGHSFGEWNVTLVPECESTGTKRRDCTNCDHYEEEVIDALGHVEVIDKAVSSTCEDTGLMQGSHCDRCNETLVKQKVVPALGHNYNSVVTEPTCEEQGYTTYICNRCDSSYIDLYVNATGHRFCKWIITLEPSCEIKGIKYRNCENCEYYEKKLIAALGHDYESVVTNPTCEDKGYTKHICNICNDFYLDSYLEATGHTFGEWNVTVEPGCEIEGTRRRKCTNCDYYEEDVMVLLGHNYESLITKPTCVEQGYTTHTCSRCDDSYVDSYVNATGHNYRDWVVTLEPGCETEGAKRRDCVNCNYFEEEEIAELGHGKVIDSAIAPTCTETGLTEGSHCDRCNKIFTIQRIISALGHNYKSITTSPTCIEKGYTTNICSVCNDIQIDSYTNPLGHFIRIDYEVKVSCESVGLTQGSHCERCGEILIVQEEIPALGHEFESVIITPKCAEQGYTIHTCNRCNYSYKDSYLPPFGHNYESIITDPTCVEHGYTTHVCNICDYSYADSYINSLGHIEIIDKGIESTCIETGLSDGSHCERCSSVLITQEIIGLKKHEWSYICSFCKQINNEYYTTGLEFSLVVEKGEYYISKGVNVKNVIIPSIYNGLYVTGIEAFAFSDCTLLESIVIPDCITTIGRYAFSSCEAIEYIVIPNGVYIIDNYAFLNCKSLQSIVIPSSVTKIGEDILGECDSLESISVDMNNIYYDSRDNCNAIIETETNELIYGCKNTIIPESVISIGDYAFHGCSNLFSINIPESVTNIGNCSFSYCDNLENIVIPNSVKCMGYNVFTRCTNLKNITLSTNIEKIDYATFSNCTSLTTIIIPDSVIDIRERAFEGCSSLKELYISKNVINIEKNALFYCDSLTTLALPTSAVELIQKEILQNLVNVIINGGDTILPYSFSYCKKIESVTIPISVISIEPAAFEYCVSLKDVYYYGNKSQWDDISISRYNSNYLNKATLHCNYKG